MKTILPLSMLFAVTVAGCTSDHQGDAPDGDADGGDAAQPVPATPEGTYAMQSHFDLAANIPGTAGTIASYVIDATDSPGDPTLFILQKLTTALPDGQIKDAVALATPYVAGYLNDRILEVAPTFVTKMLALGSALGQVTTDFGTLEVLEIDGTGRAVKTVKGLRFEIDGAPQELAFADHGVAETRTPGLAVTLSETGALAIGEHELALRYGQLMRLVLDAGLIPLIDPASSSLGELFERAVDCKAVGRYIHEAIGFGSASTFEAACAAGLGAGASALYDLMSDIDGAALELTLTGAARGVDRNRDGKMDEVVAGTWSGSLRYAGTPAPLATAKFFGARM